MYILREHDNRLFVLSLYTATDDPVVIRAWFPTGIVASRARRELGIENLDGAALRAVPGGGGLYEFADPSFGRLQVQLESGGQTTSTYRDEVPVSPPRTRRRGRIYWDRGEWAISDPRGRETIANEASIISREVQMIPPGVR